MLVIFIITVPAIQHSVKIDLPKAAAQQALERVEA
ncbi:hypothetical protein PSYJA_46371, partial [Pseudomonas syringae pv. japonica str. M301072]